MTDLGNVATASERCRRLVDCCCSLLPRDVGASTMQAAAGDDCCRLSRQGARQTRVWRTTLLHIQQPAWSIRPAMVTFVTMQLVRRQQLQATEAVTTTAVRSSIHQSSSSSSWRRCQLLQLRIWAPLTLCWLAELLELWVTLAVTLWVETTGET